MLVATTRYLGALTVLSEEDMRAPSLLPGWSRGHVVTHLARNADALCNLVAWAETGVETPMYRSQEHRDHDIDSGAGRCAEDLREDARISAGRFVGALNELDARHQDALVSRTSAAEPFPVRDIARMRRTEVEVHHADLEIGYTAADWPRDFTEMVIGLVQDDRAEGPSMVLSSTDTAGLWKCGTGPGPEITATKAELAWWLLGRGVGTGLSSSAGVLPELGRWR